MKNVFAFVTIGLVFNIEAFPVPLFSKKPATRSIKYWHLTNKKNCIRTIKLCDFKTARIFYPSFGTFNKLGQVRSIGRLQSEVNNCKTF